jgi:hypothetical protein
VDLVGERELDEDAVDVGVGVQAGDEGEELALGDACGEAMHFAGHADFFGGFFFVADVDRGGGVVAGEDDVEARRAAGFLAEFGDAAGDFGSYRLRDRFSVDELGHAGRLAERGGWSYRVELLAENDLRNRD